MDPKILIWEIRFEAGVGEAINEVARERGVWVADLANQVLKNWLRSIGKLPPE